MSDLFDQVIHHLEGEETFTQEWQTKDGTKSIKGSTFGPDRWIEPVHERGILTGLDCLALIAFALYQWGVDYHRKVVEAWAEELRKAAAQGEITARDSLSLLPLPTFPAGWGWCMSMTDADRFVESRGMEWTCSEVAAHLYRESEPSRNRIRFPAEICGKAVEQCAATPYHSTAPTKAPVGASGEPQAHQKMPIQRARAQEAAVLAAIAKAGYSPKSLPRAETGKKGVKSEIRAALTSSPLFKGNVFNKTWERLRACGEIADA